MDCMEITERQKSILNILVEEYVRSVEPVSSQQLEKKHDFGVSPATIRNEMQKLTDAGLISQPHTSAGRVPTDKGYRFYVDDLLKRKSSQKASSDLDTFVEKELQDTFDFFSQLTKSLAENSSTLALSHILGERFFWKEGWETMIQEPEFREEDTVDGFRSFLRGFEKEVEDFDIREGVNVFIGRENPFPRSRDFSLIISRCKLPGRKKGILALTGPKRMSYQKNINSLNSLLRILEKL